MAFIPVSHHEVMIEAILSELAPERTEGVLPSE
jgi:hypothetical protein